MRSIVRTSALLAALVAAPVLLAVGCQGATNSSLPTQEPVTRATTIVTPSMTTAALIGDDNRDGIIREEESGWKCRTMGNSRCGKRPVALVCIAKKVKDPVTGRPVNATRVPTNLIPACVTLAAKPGHWETYQGAKVYVAPGAARVIECRTQGLTRTELGYCLNQK